MLNEVCSNPACILSCPSTWDAYDTYRHLQFNIRFYNQLLEEQRTQWEILTESLNAIPLKDGNQTSIYRSKRMCESGKKYKKKYSTSTTHPKKDPKWTRSKIEV